MEKISSGQRFLEMTYDQRIDFFLKYMVDNRHVNSISENDKDLAQLINGSSSMKRAEQVVLTDNENVNIYRQISDVYAIMEYNELCTYNDTYGGVKNYIITQKGIVININGGWLKFKAEEERKRNLEIENIEASIKTAGLVEKNMIFQKATTYTTLIVAGVAAFASIMQWRAAEKTLQQNNIEMQSKYKGHLYFHEHRN
jgi:hypothetical protein